MRFPFKPAVQREIELKVMSFNVRYGTAKDGKNSWSHRNKILFSVLKQYQADIFCFQETLFFQIEEISTVLKKFGYIGKGRDDGKQSGEHNVIFYNPKRFKTLRSGTFWFSLTPNVPGSKHWGNNLPRICTWALFFDKKTSERFFVYNIHLDHRSAEARRKSANFLIQRMNQHKKDNIPVILLGDFNTGERNEIIQFVKGKVCLRGCHNNENPLVDTYRILYPKANGCTFHMFLGNKFGPKLDYIFAPKESSVIDCSIIRKNENGKFPSDHFPLYAHIVLK